MKGAGAGAWEGLVALTKSITAKPILDAITWRRINEGYWKNTIKREERQRKEDEKGGGWQGGGEKRRVYNIVYFPL